MSLRMFSMINKVAKKLIGGNNSLAISLQVEEIITYPTITFQTNPLKNIHHYNIHIISLVENLTTINLKRKIEKKIV